MSKWCMFTVKKELEKTKNMIESKGLEIFEVRKLTALEKLKYGFRINAPIWIVMFYGSEAGYKSLFDTNELTTVF